VTATAIKAAAIASTERLSNYRAFGRATVGIETATATATTAEFINNTVGMDPS
jgi:hypothetical protein